jgi:esterase/lipase superfamily enzyme
MNAAGFAEFQPRLWKMATSATSHPIKPLTGGILVLAANTEEVTFRQLQREAKLIRQWLYESEAGRRHPVRPKQAFRQDDLRYLLLQYDPLVVHFKGDGSRFVDIVLKDDRGQIERVPPDALHRSFAAASGRVDCVVLRGCYSHQLAEALLSHVACVVGLSSDADDETAQRFAAGFYRGLASDKDYHTAFELGRNEIIQGRLRGTPHFLSRDFQVLRATLGRVRKPRVSVSYGQEWPTTSAASEQRDLGSTMFTEGGTTARYPVWYGTNRKLVDPKDFTKRYSAKRDERMHYGQCYVDIPKSHKIGELGSAWWKRLLSGSDDRLRLSTFYKMKEAEFWKDVQQALLERDAGERMALVYIHGYNVSFDEAALRAAQIGYDLQVPGITAFFSWPSQGSVIGYPADEAAIEASEQYIADFLSRFASESGADRVHVISHSMGNRGLLRALQRIVRQAAAATKTMFGQIFLAAPDVDAQLFRQLASVHHQLADRTTLYVCARDRALASSGILHDYPRAGYTPPVTVVDGIDTVEVTNIDLTLLGHGYYAAARDFLHDIHRLLIHNDPPPQRLGLRRAHTEGGQPYWIINS